MPNQEKKAATPTRSSTPGGSDRLGAEDGPSEPHSTPKVRTEPSQGHMYGKLDDHLPSDFYDKSLVFAIDGCTHSDNPMLAVASSAEWRFGSYRIPIQALPSLFDETKQPQA